MKINFKSSHQGGSGRKGILKNFPNFTGKHLCQSLFFKTPFLKNTSWLLPLKFIKDFKQKAQIFNSRFSKQYSLINNNSKILSECPRKLNESFFLNKWY